MHQLSLGTNTSYKLLCLGAHSDDIEIGCGGSLLKLIENYPISYVKWVVFSSNEERAIEARESAEIFLEKVPHKDIIVKQFRDGFFPYDAPEIKAYFEEIKKGFNPDIVFTHYRDDRHQDHRTISDLTWNTFRNHFVLEYEIPKYDGDLGNPNFFVQIEPAQLEKKIEILLKCFRTQANKHWFDRETFLSLLRIRGMQSASPSNYSEAFYSRKVVI